MSNESPATPENLPLSSKPSVIEAVGPGDLPRLDISSPAASASIYMQGAHLASWTPAGERPVLFMSRRSMFQPGEPLRGGIPVIFPWFGAHASHPSSPPHAFARRRTWQLQTVESRNDDVVLLFELQVQSDSDSAWPHTCEARLAIRIGQQLAMTMHVANTSNQTIQFEQALHTYFAVNNVRNVKLTGLKGAQYIDKMRQGATFVQDEPALGFTSETDRVYVNTESTCEIVDPDWNRRIVIAKRGSSSTVVWNPWVDKSIAMPDFADDEWPGMLCVESANIGTNAISLKPGERHQMEVAIAVKH